MADTSTNTETARGPLSAWRPLKVPLFRTVWVAVLIGNIGSWMASVATAWLMITLDASPLMVSLVSVATNLPLFLIALPAGALADIVDRRKLLIIAQIFMMAVTLILCVFVSLGWITPVVLLVLIFLIEAGSAVETPAYLAVLPELVPKKELQSALALNGVGINISRIVGPGLGGLLIGAIGVGNVLVINAATFAAVIFAYTHLPPPVHRSALPAERLVAAMRHGLQFVRASPDLSATLIRSAVFFLFASSYWALLPLIARDQLGGGPNIFGVLFGSQGAGAVIGAFALPYLRKHCSPDRMVLGGGLLTATMCAALALASHVLPAMLVMLVTGAGSLAVMSTLMMSAQMALPSWVKARGMAITQMVFSGALTLGSLLWGAVAERTGIPLTLAIAAAGLAAASVLVLHWPLRIQDGIDLTPSVHWPPPITAERVADDRGPVMVTVEYRIDPNTRSAFSDVLERLGQVRRRDGAFYWDHFVDTTDPTRHVEVFLAESWVEHLRQHERVTAADQRLQDQVAAFHTGGETPKVTHLISAHTDSDSGTG